MTAGIDLGEARSAGERVVGLPLRWVQSRAHRRIRRSIGVGDDPPPSCDDPALAYFQPGSIVRQLHGDLPSMLIGGLASLLLQTLNPLVMAGVSQHSRYRDDPLGRLERTARFVGVTTFGSRDDAVRAIEVVRRIHRTVAGAYEGVPYAAADPALVTWVHSSELTCFLESARRFGARPFTPDEQDAYVDEMAQVAFALGALEVPRSVAELATYLEDARPALRLTPEARDARNFVLRGVGRWPHEVATYQLLSSAAQGVLPSWARSVLRLHSVPAADALLVRPAASTFCSTLRILTPGRARGVDGPPSADRT